MQRGVTKKAASRIWFGKRPGLFVDNSRFYILVFSFLISLMVASYMRISISSDTLFFIRVQQVFGFTALAYWYVALLATPFKTIFGKDGVMKQYLYARRAIGVSAAYFASLHMLVGLFGQLGGPRNLLLLPARFQVAILFGAIALLFLLLMAVTSFDKVITWMTFPRWKWLHRLGYVGGILVLLHVWMISTHLEYSWIRVCLFGMLAAFTVLESWRITLVIEKKSGSGASGMRYILFAALAFLLCACLYFVPHSVGSYRDQHVQMGMEH